MDLVSNRQMIINYNLDYNIKQLLKGYHTLHFFSGFMPDPKGQLKSLAKCSMLERGPRILYFPGEWGAVSIALLSEVSRYLMHQPWL